MSKASETPTHGTGEAPSTSGEDLFGTAVTDMTASITEWAEAAKTSFETAIKGKYTATALSQDVAAAAARTVRDWGRMVTATAKVAGALALVPIPPPAPPPAAGGSTTPSTPPAAAGGSMTPSTPPTAAERRRSKSPEP
jgi:capsid protein